MRGRLIYFVGLDGSGKTTQAEMAVAAHSGWVYRWVRWEPRLTAPLMSLGRRLARRGHSSSRPADDASHREFVSGKQAIFGRVWVRRIWETLVLLEYLPQMAWRLLPALWSGRTVVCDRYVADVWVDLSMNFGEDFSGVRRLSRHPLSRLFPAPDLVVFLKVPARVGYDRKRDGTPLAYLQEREPLYSRLTELLPTTVVDATGNLDEVEKRIDAALQAWGEGRP